MQQSYNPQVIEPKWQKKWTKENTYSAEDFSQRPKKYILVEFPYPSGVGLHVGHVWGYTMGDVLARQSRMKGENVLFPMGWDGFGLPAENYAIKTGVHPQESTTKNIANFRKQMDQMGFSFDWGREINTTDPKYYRWTQWIFLQLYKKGLAYKAEMPINWCPACQSGLANEEVTSDNCHERCGKQVTKRMVEQWLLKITAYADRLIDDLDLVDYTNDIKKQQINWIGRSKGAYIKFTITNRKDRFIKVFTTRADTLPGTTFIALAPETPLLADLTISQQKNDVDTYVQQALKKFELERSQLQKQKSGVFTGSYAINPINGESIPVWIADYVMLRYGTGAIMGVPAHDERDLEFAQVYQLPIKEVKNLGPQAAEGIIRELSKQDLAEEAVEYKLRDWIFSRQHYWGEPIPIIYCEKCGEVPVPEEDLPVMLPEIEDYEPTNDGKSPLAKVKEWVNVSCPKCQGPAQRETDTMPNWAGSSWYYLRYCDPQNGQALADRKRLNYFLPVDLYIGGAEHTTLHLLYSRFWHEFLFDLGVVNTPEPYKKRRNRGLILGSDGRKMSKSLGNVINPDEEVAKVGADTLRLYELFIGPYKGTFAWDPKAEKGIYRFLERTWQVTAGIAKNNFSSTQNNILAKLHQVIQKVEKDSAVLKFNTAIAALMEFVNLVGQNNLNISKQDWEKFLLVLAPFAPFISEHLWQQYYCDEKNPFISIHTQDWPQYDPALIKEEQVTIAVQVNGKLRGTLEIENQKIEEKDNLINLAKQIPNVAKHLVDNEIQRTISVRGKLINFVVKASSEKSTQ